MTTTPHDLAVHWERIARTGARDRRNIDSRIYAAIKELEKLPDSRAMKIINILKGENNA